MADLKTDYKDQLLDTSVNTERKFNLVDSGGNVIASGVTLRDITQYSQAGDTFGAADVNKITTEINGINTNLENLIIKRSFVSSSPASMASGNIGQSTINIIVPDGYELLFCDVVDEGSGTIVDYYSITNNVLKVASRNIGSGTKICSPRANCLFIKTT